MQQPIISEGVPQNEIAIPDAIESRTNLVIKLCEKLIEKNTVLFVGEKAHTYYSLPFFIHEIYTHYRFNLDVVVDRFSSDIASIQNEQLKILEFLTKKNNN